jgi:lipopolysaccharide transport system permease protein
MSILDFDKHDFHFIINIWRIGITDRYLGSLLGVAWAILNPLLMFALFTFVFAFVFKAKLPGADSTLEYSIWLICGYGPWLANAESLTAASNSIITNSGLVKNLSFKTEVLPIAYSLLGLAPLTISIVFMLLVQIFSGIGTSLDLFYLPIVIFIHFLFLIAIGIILSAITTFIRDFSIVLPNLLMIALFSTPIFYPIETLPNIGRVITQFNPFFIISSAYRSIIFDHQPPNLLSLFFLGLICYFFLLIFLTIFRRVKNFFPSII